MIRLHTAATVCAGGTSTTLARRLARDVEHVADAANKAWMSVRLAATTHSAELRLGGLATVVSRVRVVEGSPTD